MERGARNIAYIDGQNMHLATTTSSAGAWRVDFARFRRFLHERYSVDEAFYFLGYVVDDNDKLYDAIQRAGFI